MKNSIWHIHNTRIKEPSFYYKQITSTDQQKLINSIKEHGVLRNIVVRKLDETSYEVVEGRNILKACKELGIEEIPCVDKDNITIQQAQRINITLNLLHSYEDHASIAYDIAMLAKDVSVNELCASLPYTPEQVIRFKEISEFSWEGFKKQYSNDQVGMFDTPDSIVEEIKHQDKITQEDVITELILENSKSNILKQVEKFIIEHPDKVNVNEQKPVVQNQETLSEHPTGSKREECEVVGKLEQIEHYCQVCNVFECTCPDKANPIAQDNIINSIQLQESETIAEAAQIPMAEAEEIIEQVKEPQKIKLRTEYTDLINTLCGTKTDVKEPVEIQKVAQDSIKEAECVQEPPKQQEIPVEMPSRNSSNKKVEDLFSGMD